MNVSRMNHGSTISVTPAPAKPTVVRLDAAAPATPALTPGLRAPVVTRRYEIAWATADGGVDRATRAAPALPDFEECAAAFARGTVIATTTGFCAVEDLEPGMTVITADGRSEPITWIGSITLYSQRDGHPGVTLTRVTAEAFGVGRPMSDTVLGPRARILLRDPRCKALTGSERVFAPARGFEDGISVVEVRPLAPVTMFHIALARHGALRAGGIDVEAFHPGPARAELTDPQLTGHFLALFPHITSLGDFGPLAHPRISGADLAAL